MYDDKLMKQLKESWTTLESSLDNLVVYHGTDISSAKDIRSNGINMDASQLGYFGKGFYTTPNESLAKSNYADFSEDGPESGVVLKFKVDPKANLLDLRKEDDWLSWRDGTYRGVKYDALRHKQEFDKIMRSEGIDGLYDESFGGWVFYNPEVLSLIE